MSERDLHEADGVPDEPACAPARKPWHKPRVILSDVARTEVGPDAITDSPYNQS